MGGLGNAHYAVGKPKGSQFKNCYRNLWPLSDDAILFSEEEL